MEMLDKIDATVFQAESSHATTYPSIQLVAIFGGVELYDIGRISLVKLIFGCISVCELNVLYPVVVGRRICTIPIVSSRATNLQKSRTCESLGNRSLDTESRQLDEQSQTRQELTLSCHVGNNLHSFIMNSR